LTLVCGIVGSSGLLPPLGVLVGEARRSLQRVGKMGQDLRGLLRALPRMCPNEFSSTRFFAVDSTRIGQLGPSTLQLGSMALVLGHLKLKLSPLRILLLIPEPGGALMVLRRQFVPDGSIPMSC
jgi:hypothetical protein